MAQIQGMEGLTNEQVSHELRNGAKFVMFKYCISIVVMTFNRTSDIYYIRPGESSFKHGIGWTLLTLVLGWWGIPWGPIYTLGALGTNLSGGKDVTQEILNSMGQQQQQAQRQRQPANANPNNSIDNLRF